MTPSCTQGVRPCPPPQPCDPLGDGDWFASLRGHSSWTVLSPPLCFRHLGYRPGRMWAHGECLFTLNSAQSAFATLLGMVVV